MPDRPAASLTIVNTSRPCTSCGRGEQCDRRTCEVCGTPICDRRQDAVVCGASCRAVLSRARRSGAPTRPSPPRDVASRQRLPASQYRPRGAAARGGGFVYAIEAPELQRVKIGVAIRPEQRLRNLQCSAPCELELRAATWVSNAYAVEAELHERFASARVVGEWFDAVDEEVAAWLATR